MRLPLSRADLARLALLVAVVIAALWIGWIGFMASDDALYHAGALRWATAPPFAGSDHWTTRLPLMWLFAGMIALLGDGYPAFAATALVPYLALVALAASTGANEGGAGWRAALLVATMPVIVGNASIVGVDLLEGALLVGGALLLARGRGFLAGLCFGAAIVCRETALLALAGLAPLFVLGRPVARRTLLEAGIGVALALGAEAAFQWSLTGDPLRRYAIAFHHDEHIDRAANREGNFLLHPAIDPLLVLLINDDFGLLFWLAIPAAIAMRGRAPPTPVLGAMAWTSFALVAALAHKLVLNPRYFLLAAIWTAVLVARWLGGLRPRVRGLILAGVVGSNVALLGLGNAHPHWAMEALVAAARDHRAESVAADPALVRRAAVPIALERLRNVRAGRPRPGELAITDEPAPGGSIVARYPSPPTRVGAVVRAMGLVPLVPAPIARRLFAPNPEVLLVRAPG